MKEIDTEVAMVALSRAREADREFWARTERGRKGRHFRRVRDRAVLEALTAGMPLELIADEMGVLISDVERMAASGRLP